MTRKVRNPDQTRQGCPPGPNTQMPVASPRPEHPHHTFICGECGETFQKIRSDEEAWAEAAKLFPNDTLFAVVCEACWNKLMERDSRHV